MPGNGNLWKHFREAKPQRPPHPQHWLGRQGPRRGGDRARGELLGLLPVPRLVRALVRRRRRQAGQGQRVGREPGDLQQPDAGGGAARGPGRRGHVPLRRGRGLLRPQPPGRRGGRRRADVPARRCAGTRPAHPRPGARLGLLRPGDARGHPRRSRRGWEDHGLRLRVVPAAVGVQRGDRVHGRPAAVARRLRRGGHGERRLAVQDREPPHHGPLDRERLGAAQGRIPPGSGRTAGALRLGADGRRARVCRRDGSGRVPEAEHRELPVARRPRGRGERRGLGAVPGELEGHDRDGSARAAGSRSAGSRAPSQASSPRSRSTP